MPSEGWITVPGKGKRYRMGDGSYRLTPPPPGYEMIKGLLGPMATGATAGGLGIWSAPARAQEPPAATTGGSRIPDAKDLLNSSVNNRDPRFAPAPGQGAPAPVVSPAGRARDEALNAASQQAGGPNLSKPIVPTEAEAQAQREFAAAREANPLAAVPEILDQRSEAYANREGISQWLKAMQGGSKSDQEIARRFLAKQNRQANPVQDMPAGTRLMGGDGSEQGVTAYDAKRLEAFEKDGAHLRAVESDINASRDIALRPRDMERNPLINPMLTPEGSAQAYQAAANGMEFVPQATAQAGNLAFSPLPEANQSQLLQDEEKAWRMQFTSDLLNKYKGQALAFNNGNFAQMG